MNERRISVTAPTTFPDDPKTLADGEEEEEENTNVRFGTVYLTGRSSGGSSVSTSLYVSLAETVDLTGQPSNCYIINKSNARYCIDVTRKGEDTEATMSPASVAILWETPYKVIEFPKLVDGKAYFYHAIGTDDDEKEFFNHGNALLGAFDAAGNLLWSWHLWCAEFDPADEQVELGGEVMMKRNLGAGVVSGTSEEDILASYGVYYQWGRKDPFPGDRILRGTNQTDYNRFDSKPIYDAAGTLLTEGSQSGGTGIRTIRTSEDLTRTNFAKSIFSPMHFLLADDWFPSKEPLKVEACDTLWCGARGKTPFDPCPEGWCVPADKNGLFAWNGLDKATTDYSPLGVFPYAGFRYRVGGGCLKNSGFNTGIWTQDTYQLSIYIIPYDQRPSIKRDRGYRSDGYSVRCAKDE